MIAANFRKYKFFILLVGGLVILTGIAVVTGWLLNIPILKHVGFTFATMKFNTALGFMVLGSSLLLLATHLNKRLILLGKFLSVLTFLLGILSFSEEILHFIWGIDQIAIIDLESLVSKNPHPGRMSPLTSVCFMFTSLSLIILDSKRQRVRSVAQMLLHLTTLLSFIAITGYLFNVPTFYKLSFITSMAVHTAVSFFLLSIATSLLNPSLAITGLFTGNTIGSIMARKLFFQMSIAILFLGYLRIESHRLSMVSTEFGIALLTISFMLVSLLLIWRVSNELTKIDLEKISTQGNLSRIKTFLDSTPDPIVIADAKGTILLINNQAEHIFGYPRAELTGEKLTVLLPVRLRSKEQASLFTPAGATGTIAPFEIFALKKDGSEFPAEISISTIESSDGRNVSVAIRDITWRKQSERELAQVTYRLKLATQTSVIGIWDYDVVNNILVWDDAMFKLYNADRETFLGAYDAWRSGLHPDDVERGDAEIAMALQGEKEFDTEFRIVWRDHSVHYIKAKAMVMRNEKGEAIQMIGTNWDITDQKTAENKLNESNQRNKIFIDQAPNAIAMFDTEMRYMAASRKWIKDYHLSGKEIMGRSHYEIFPEIGDDWKLIHQQCLHGAINTCDEAAFERADGSLQWITWDVRPWYISEGHIGGILMYTADITEVKQKDEEGRRIKEILDKTSEVARIGTWELNTLTSTITWSRMTKEIHEVPYDYVPDFATAIDSYKEGESVEKIKAAVAEAMAHGTPFDLELELVTAKKNIVWVRAIGQAEFSKGVCKRLYGVFHDINIIKGSSEDLNKLNQELEAIFNAGAVSIIGTDTKGLITHFSQGAETLLHYSAAEMVDTHTPALLHLEAELVKRGEELSTLHNRAIRGFDVLVEMARQGKSESREWTYVRKDGSTFPVQLVVTAIRNKMAEVTGFLGVATDIQEQRNGAVCIHCFARSS